MTPKQKLFWSLGSAIAGIFATTLIKHQLEKRLGPSNGVPHPLLADTLSARLLAVTLAFLPTPNVKLGRKDASFQAAMGGPDLPYLPEGASPAFVVADYLLGKAGWPKTLVDRRQRLRSGLDWAEKRFSGTNHGEAIPKDPPCALRRTPPEGWSLSLSPSDVAKEPTTTQGESVWTAPPGARCTALSKLALDRPSTEPVRGAREEARKRVASRVAAYRTPVTDETLRRSLP